MLSGFSFGSATDVFTPPYSCVAGLPGWLRIPNLLIMSLLLSAFATTVRAESRFEEDFDDKDKSWQEIAIQLPAIPAPENLFGFYVSPTATQSFSIDAKSLTVGSDGVVRYILVSKSASGAENTSYEGIRCQSLEKKLYAFGRHDGTWSRSRRDQWEPVYGNAANRQHAALAQDYLCDGRTVAGNAGQIIERIRAKKPLLP